MCNRSLCAQGMVAESTPLMYNESNFSADANTARACLTVLLVEEEMETFALMVEKNDAMNLLR